MIARRLVVAFISMSAGFYLSVPVSAATLAPAALPRPVPQAPIVQTEAEVKADFAKLNEIIARVSTKPMDHFPISELDKAKNDFMIVLHDLNGAIAALDSSALKKKYELERDAAIIRAGIGESLAFSLLSAEEMYALLAAKADEQFRAAVDAFCRLKIRSHTLPRVFSNEEIPEAIHKVQNDIRESRDRILSLRGSPFFDVFREAHNTVASFLGEHGWREGTASHKGHSHEPSIEHRIGMTDGKAPLLIEPPSKIANK